MLLGYTACMHSFLCFWQVHWGFCTKVLSLMKESNNRLNKLIPSPFYNIHVHIIIIINFNLRVVLRYCLPLQFQIPQQCWKVLPVQIQLTLPHSVSPGLLLMSLMGTFWIIDSPVKCLRVYPCHVMWPLWQLLLSSPVWIMELNTAALSQLEMHRDILCQACLAVLQQLRLVCVSSLKAPVTLVWYLLTKSNNRREYSLYMYMWFLTSHPLPNSHSLIFNISLAILFVHFM